MPNAQLLPHTLIAETRYPPAHQPDHPAEYPVCDLLQWQEQRQRDLADLRKQILQNRNRPQ
ncbi:MAG: hypothetical protein IJE88_04295 [Akkermansia sp.]|nr:hypothetical protein [Akkermansia sp.]